jgi:hypothetical protein
MRAAAAGWLSSAEQRGWLDPGGNFAAAAAGGAFLLLLLLLLLSDVLTLCCSSGTMPAAKRGAVAAPAGNRRAVGRWLLTSELAMDVMHCKSAAVAIVGSAGDSSSFCITDKTGIYLPNLLPQGVVTAQDYTQYTSCSCPAAHLLL